MAENDDDDHTGEVTQKITKMGLDEIKTIPVVCPWCNQIFKLSRWQTEANKKIGISHGICPECFKKLQKEC